MRRCGFYVEVFVARWPKQSKFRRCNGRFAVGAEVFYEMPATALMIVASKQGWLIFVDERDFLTAIGTELAFRLRGAQRAFG